MTTSRAEEVSHAIDTAAEAVFEARRPDGVFDYGRRASTLSTASAVTALHCCDARGSADLVERGAAWLRAAQSATGGWSALPGGPDEAGPTAVACATLQLVAPEAAANPIAAGHRWMLEHGGLDALARSDIAACCRWFYSLVGWLDPDRVPLELVVPPSRFHRALDLRTPVACALVLARAARGNQLERLLARAGAPRAVSLLRGLQEHVGGGWHEDPWVTGLICAGLARAGFGGELLPGAVAWLRARVNADGSWNDAAPELTWTADAASGLLEAGFGTDERLVPTRELLLRDQQDRPCPAFGCPAGFWASSGPRDWPAAPETGAITSVLRRFPGDRSREAVRRGVEWLSAQQDSRGSWGPVRNARVPCPHVTAQSLEALLDSGVPAEDRRVRRAVRWLRRAQRPDGGWDSRRYRPRTATTSAVLQVLVRTGPEASTAVRAARGLLLRAQLPDGSWSTGGGEEPGTAEETAWALGALLAAGVAPEGAEIRRGVQWLLDARRPTGSWSAAPVTEGAGLGARRANRALADGLALRALARYRDAAGRN
ncbi:prenyltransferase/squalene oxidase repeat-containing protein [Saccharopolyspora sp. MS10]|uniref:prenyltransferase/squalene oxidase repeat-containing protein n=1 Tax=Saccharopolyspora sp. MS10 TaxID=3385973 RepID=UPI0039A0F371